MRINETVILWTTLPSDIIAYTLNLVSKNLKQYVDWSQYIDMNGLKRVDLILVCLKNGMTYYNIATSHNIIT